ncbi:MAG: hypothetical protein HUK19_09560 [Fibrobacter sp.]|nr:hypothetical protein [Fibrobacter sp.]
MIYRLTKEALDAIGGEYEESTKAQSRFDEWYVKLYVKENIMEGYVDFYFVFSNAYSLFSIIVDGNKIDNPEELHREFCKALREYLAHLGREDYYEKYLGAGTSSFSVQKRTNRSVSSGQTNFLVHVEVGRMLHELSGFRLLDFANDYITNVFKSEGREYAYSTELFFDEDYMSKDAADVTIASPKAAKKTRK